MYKKLLATITSSSIFMLCACGGLESDIETALNNDKEHMSICGKFNSSNMSLSINGLHNTRIKVYPVKGSDLKEFWKKSRNDVQCFGDRSVTTIEEFTTPSDLGGMKITEVVFSYKMELNDLARNLRVDESIQNAFDKPLKAKAVLVETNNGWRIEKATWSPYSLLAKTKVITSEKYARELRPNCAACQDMLRDGVDYSKLPASIIDTFRDKNHFAEACGSVRRSCSENDVIY